MAMKIILLTTLIILQKIVSSKCELKWNATFEPSSIEIFMGKSEGPVNLTLYGLTQDILDPNLVNDRNHLRIYSTQVDVAGIEEIESLKFELISESDGIWRTQFNVAGLFLGRSHILVELVSKSESSENFLEVIILKKKKIVDILFKVSVSAFIAMMYVSFGATLDFSSVKGILKKPIGPLIGFVSQFVFMPLAAYGWGLLLFPNKSELAIGLFFIGVSPGGGGSNVWSLLLGGNLNLSITMTTISTLLAFFSIPLWLFTLGNYLFSQSGIEAPRARLIRFAISLFIPLAIGILIQKFLPRLRDFLLKILKPLAAVMMIFIIVFAIVSYRYLLSVWSWQIVVAALSLPWGGFLFGWIFSRLFRQELPDSITVAIETGIQNTAISIYLLNFSMPEPESDLSLILPIAVKIFAPLPLVALLIGKIILRRVRNRNNTLIINKDESTRRSLRKEAETHKINFFDVFD